MQLSLFEHQTTKVPQRQLLYDLFQAYYDARKNKRNTKSALAFEKNYEHNLFELYEEVTNRKYEVNPSICFINFSPVQREIFAAHFRDRVVHHLVYNYISPIFERVFINDSYSCRTGKGTSYGIQRINKFIRSCSNNYQSDCYILRLDIKGYFMSINREILYRKTLHVLTQFRYRNFTTTSGEIKQWNQIFDFETIIYLLKKIIYNDPTKNYFRRGNINYWKGLPPSKSLFHSPTGCGLPIGNLTSQLFSNIYLNDFDHWVLHSKNCKYYGRYVDDFIIVHRDKEFLKTLIPQIKQYLKQYFNLELHPNKIYLQHFTKGVKFLGAVIKPYRIYIANRTKGNFYKTIKKHNEIVRDHKPSKEEKAAFLSSINSYLGIMKHYKSYNIRKTLLKKNISGWWENYFMIKYRYNKIEKKNKIIKS